MIARRIFLIMFCYGVVGVFFIAPAIQLNARCPDIFPPDRAALFILAWPAVVINAFRYPPTTTTKACWENTP